jgi:hypothetical protein
LLHLIKSTALRISMLKKVKGTWVSSGGAGRQARFVHWKSDALPLLFIPSGFWGSRNPQAGFPTWHLETDLKVSPWHVGFPYLSWPI